MTKFNFAIREFGYRDTLGRFAERSRRTVPAQRTMARAAGRELVRLLKMNAPKKTGEFAAGLYYRTYDRGNGTEIRFYVKGKHAYVLPFLVNGTVDHEIPTGGSAAQIAKGYPLSFFWEKGPAGAGRYSYWSVHHPGTNPDPFVGQARAAAEPFIHELLRRTAGTIAWL